MRINAAVNIAILFIHALSLLMSECQGDFGLFCSPTHTWVFAQYFKIIMNEYVSNCLRLVSNFTYAGFAINRISLIGNKHGKFVTYLSKLKLWEFIVRVIAPCLILPIVKIFRFQPSISRPDYEYPNPIAYMFNKIDIAVIFVFLSFNMVFDLINYVGFLIVNFTLDLTLFFKIRTTINEKEMKKAKIGVSTTSESKNIKKYFFNLAIFYLLKIINFFSKKR